MKHILWSICIPFVIISCTGGEEVLPRKEENFYMNFSLGDSLYSITTDDYQLEAGRAFVSCVKPYLDSIFSSDAFVFGDRPVSLVDPKEGGFITSLSLTVSNRVDRNSLSTTDELGYMRQVLGVDSFGFPALNTGYYVAYDPEQNEFVADNKISAAYLSIVTKNGSYFSTTVASKVHVDGSFFKINAITEVVDSIFSEYQYIIEGSFMVDVFKDQAIESELAAGTFRWPIAKVANSELLTLCEE